VQRIAKAAVALATIMARSADRRNDTTVRGRDAEPDMGDAMART
jgi:hypothetical protein